MAVRARLRLFVALGLPLLVVASLLARDLSRPPAQQVTARLAVSAIRWYHTSLSPHIGARCRFKPSCSQYAIAVIERHGLLGGGWRAAWRIARCGPWTPVGTIDPPD
jgi:putative membrane protein insertion efficiency factor